MATVNQHIEQWKHNRRFVQTIDPAFDDWQVNAIFYVAVHAVDAALAHLGIQVQDHQHRNQAVQSNQSLSAIRDLYMHLYRISVVTRYDAEPQKWLPKKFLTVQALCDGLLKPIENNVEVLIGKKVTTAPVSLKQ